MNDLFPIEIIKLSSIVGEEKRNSQDFLSPAGVQMIRKRIVIIIQSERGENVRRSN